MLTANGIITNYHISLPAIYLHKPLTKFESDNMKFKYHRIQSQLFSIPAITIAHGLIISARHGIMARNSDTDKNKNWICSTTNGPMFSQDLITTWRCFHRPTGNTSILKKVKGTTSWAVVMGKWWHNIRYTCPQEQKPVCPASSNHLMLTHFMLVIMHL